MKQEMQGMYTLRKYCAITGKLKQTVGPFCNKITDIGLNRVGTTGAITSYCYVGTGTAPSQFTDINMGSLKIQAGLTTTANARSSVVPYWHQQTRTYRFAAGVINGNITEVGVGWASAPLNNLWSRELIVDSGGNPITLTVLENEFLDVTYSLRFYPSTADFTGSVAINGITYNYTGRTAAINSSLVSETSAGIIVAVNTFYAGPTVLGPVTGTITGQTASGGGAIVTRASYVNNSLTTSATSAFSLTLGNLAGGITAAVLKTIRTGGVTEGLLQQDWQLVFDKPIPKTNENTLGLTLQISWARYSGTIVP